MPVKASKRALKRLRDEPGKVALVLAGGGIIGGVYQIGALKALNDVMQGRTVNDFDIYVGTSCGAFVASCLANRITPEEMMASLAGEEVEGFRFHRADLLKFNSAEAAEKVLWLPYELTRFLWSNARRMRPFPPTDILYHLLRSLPSGIYDSLAIDRLLGRLFTKPRTNDFGSLGKELFIAATDIGTATLRLFSRGDAVSISRAVAASTAIPVVYSPVKIEDRFYVDGGLNDTMHVDAAVNAGAKLIVCINPLVSYVKDADAKTAGHHVFDLGFPFVGKQVVRTILSTRVDYDLRRLRRHRPDVDVILIQPDERDFKMFYNPIMRYATRVEVAVHGFASAARTLSRHYEAHQSIFARHGIGTRLDEIVTQLEAIEALGPRSRGAASVLEGVARKYRLAPGTRGPLAPLAHALHDLDVLLHRTGGAQPASVPAAAAAARSAVRRPRRRKAAKVAAAPRRAAAGGRRSW